MGPFGPVNWHAVLIPDTPILEIVVRGTLVYLALFGLLRFILKRQSGAVGVTDLLVVVLIADAAQNAMAAEYKSVPDGVLLVAVIIGWSYALDWLGHKVPAVGRLVHPPPLLLVKDGKVLLRNLRRELITKQELMSQLREQGVDGLAKVKRAYMEGDGKISVVTTDRAQHPTTKKGQT
jgi:uncharacterized membrane protein YcaP (DUF421 family)